MSRLYYKDTTRPRGGYLVPASPCGLQRPNRRAAGFSAMLEHKKRRHPLGASQSPLKLEGDMLTLAVRGTLDSLAAGRFDLERVKCPCCDTLTNKVRLKPGAAKARRLKLNRLRKARLTAC